jgi:cell division septation protein DedD
MAASQDTEITLGTGKMLLLFFSLVAICAVFFGVGFSLGKNSSRSLVSTDSAMTTPPVPSVARPSGGKAATAASSTSVSDEYKPVGAKAPETSVNTADKASDSGDVKPASESPATTASIPTTTIPGSGYFVQVAAVSKVDDAEALVAALKNKQYGAFVAATSANDKLFRVQVGPFSDLKEAEATRAKLVGDGYNPIVKK